MSHFALSACASVTDPPPRPTADKPKPRAAGKLPKWTLRRAELPSAGLILSLDPSSTCTGYALLDLDGKLVTSGPLRPSREHAANERIRSMARQVEVIVGERRPVAIVIEDTSGKVGARHGGGGAGLAIHGKAVGAIWTTVDRLVGAGSVWMVPENVWTGGRQKKSRQRTVALEHHVAGYQTKGDAGGDVSDAIGLGTWWLREQRNLVIAAAGRAGAK